MLVATHNGSFHADELTACVILSLLHDDFRVIRSRDPEELERADIVIDVSGKFDLKKHFDHHPKEFTKTRANGIKYATAGLIWEFYGRQLLFKYTNSIPELADVDNEAISRAWTVIDNKFMQFIDLTDNGQLDTYTLEHAAPQDAQSKQVYDWMNGFFMKAPIIPALIALQNAPDGTDEEQMLNFLNTLECFKTLFNRIFINILKNSRDEAKVLQAYDGSEILLMSEKLPWFETVLNNWDKFTNCLLAVYPDHNGRGWRIQSLPGSESARFENRCSAPVSWRGREFEDLNKLAGISTATFVHKAGFTGGARTFEDVITMAKNWIKESPNKD